jgi:Spy/CpxP family protein refolding chaperone
MPRLPAVFVSAMLAATVVVGSAHARPEGLPAIDGDIQQIKPKWFVGDGLRSLLLLPRVQQELNLSDGQKEKMYKLIEEESGGRIPAAGGRAAKAWASGRQLLPNDPPATARQQKRLAEILTPRQMERLKQIDLRLLGANALRNAEVLKALNLTGPQKKKILSIYSTAEEQGVRLAPMGPGIHLGGRLQKQVDDVTEEALHVLTPQQREKFETMKGKTFDLNPPLRPLPPPGRTKKAAAQDQRHFGNYQRGRLEGDRCARLGAFGRPGTIVA